MKQAIYLLSLCMISLSVFAQSNKTPSASIQLDSIVDARVSNGNWMLSDKYAFSYGVNGELLTEIEWYWKNSVWNLDKKNEFEYDANGNMTQRLEYDADSTLWVLDEKNTFTYDANSNMLEWLRYEMDNGQWENDRKIEYGYNSDDNIIYSIRQYWDGAVWENSEKVEFTYNASKQLIQELEFDWQDSVWEYSYKSENTLDAQGRILIQVDYSWQDTIWIFDDKDSNIYNSNDQLIENYRFYWSTYYDEWRLNSREEFAYDASGNMAESVYSYYSSGQWQLSEKMLNVFDLAVDQSDIWLPMNSHFEDDFFSKSKIDASKYFDWDNSKWELEDSTAYYYSSIPFGLEEQNLKPLKIYPNPTTNVLTLQTISAATKHIEVFDLTGQLVLRKTSADQLIMLNLASLKPGVYIIRVSEKEQTTIGRIVKN